MLKQKPKKRNTRAQKQKQRFLLCFDFLSALNKHLWKARGSFRSAVRTWNPVVKDIDRRLSHLLFACHATQNVLTKFKKDPHSKNLSNFHILRAARRLCWSRDCGMEFEKVESFVLHIFQKGEAPLAWFTLPLFHTTDFLKNTKSSHEKNAKTKPERKRR